MKTKQWLNNARFTSWWLDFSDLGWPDPQLTAKWQRRASTFQKQGVNAVVMFGFHFRWDYYPVLDRVLGALGEVSAICHEHGIKVVEHHSATLVHRVRSVEDRRAIRTRNNHHVPFYPDSWETARYEGESMADWRQISASDDRPVFFERYTCECFCPNHPGYQRAYLETIQRHLAAVQVDAVMSDDLHFLPDVYSCACQHCRARFKNETGFELPPAKDLSFWGNKESPAFFAWLQARYRWNADHYRRLRAALPDDVLLWGCASNCLNPTMAELGFSPQLFAEHFDAIFHEIFHQNQPGTHNLEILSDLVGFASLARHHKKPLVALCYVNRAEDVPGWLHLLAQQGARPWISKQVRREDAIPEEELLAEGFHFGKSPRQKPAPESVQAIVFSESLRDRLDADEAVAYVEQYRQLCNDLIQRGSQPHLLFDNMWESASPALWECLWILDSRSLDDEKQKTIADWQEKGLAVGVS